MIVLHFVAASFAAGRAIEEAILAEPDIELALAQATVLLAFAAVFGHFALHAAEFFDGGGHGRTVAPAVAKAKCRR